MTGQPLIDLSKYPVKMIAINSIQDPHPVRAKPNEAFIRQYAENMAEGGSLPPGVVCEDGKGGYKMVDGRTRSIAAASIGRTEYPYCVLPPMTDSEIIIMACKLNNTGPVPMNNSDIEDVMIHSIRVGIAKKNVLDAFPHLAPSFLRQLYRHAQGKIFKQKCTQVDSYITANPDKSVREAVAEVGIDLERYLSRKREQDDVSRPKGPENSVAKFMTEKTTKFINEMGDLMSKAWEKLEDGELSHRDFQDMSLAYVKSSDRVKSRSDSWCEKCISVCGEFKKKKKKG